MTSFLDALLARSFGATGDGVRPRPRLRFEQEVNAPLEDVASDDGSLPLVDAAPPAPPLGAASRHAPPPASRTAAPTGDTAPPHAQGRHDGDAPVARVSAAVRAPSSSRKHDTLPTLDAPQTLDATRTHGASHTHDASPGDAAPTDRSDEAPRARQALPVRRAPAAPADDTTSRAPRDGNADATAGPGNVVVEITIGRIEIAAPPRAAAPPVRTPAPAPVRPALTLDAYLARRSGPRP